MDPSAISLVDAEEEYIPEDEPSPVFSRQPPPQSMRRNHYIVMQQSGSAFPERQTPIQKRTHDIQKTTKRTYKRKMTAKREFEVPYWMLAWLGLWNAKVPGPIRSIYGFVEQYFPGSLTPDSNSWQSSLRERVSQDKNLFQKVERNRNMPTDCRASSSLWTVRPGSRPLFMHKLNQWMKNKRKTPNNIGMANPDDFESILAGTKGLPEDGPEFLQQWQDTSEQPIPYDFSYKPAAKKFCTKMDDEMDAAVNSLENELIEDKEKNELEETYQPNYYQQNSRAIHRPWQSPAQQPIPYDHSYEPAAKKRRMKQDDQMEASVNPLEEELVEEKENNHSAQAYQQNYYQHNSPVVPCLSPHVEYHLNSPTVQYHNSPMPHSPVVHRQSQSPYAQYQQNSPSGPYHSPMQRQNYSPSPQVHDVMQIQDYGRIRFTEQWPQQNHCEDAAGSTPLRSRFLPDEQQHQNQDARRVYNVL